MQKYEVALAFIIILAAIIAVAVVLALLIRKFVIEPANTLINPVQENIRDRLHNLSVRKFGHLPCGKYFAFASAYTAVLFFLASAAFIKIEAETYYIVVFLCVACVAAVEILFFFIFPGDTEITYEYCVSMAGRRWFSFFIMNSDNKHKIIWSIGAVLGIILYLNIQVMLDMSAFPYPVSNFIMKYNPLFFLYARHAF